MFDENWSGLGRDSDYFAWLGNTYWVLTQSNSDPFGLVSLDLADHGTNTQSSPFTVTGYKSGGGTEVFTGSASAFETFTFGSAWANLTSVRVASGYSSTAVDNIVLNTSVVPLPPAAFLGLGLLGGLGLIGRLRTRRSA